jgi:DNA polymerase-3 subunit gamma/tau
VSYLAIARKYRPGTFDEIVGQEHVTRTLRNAIARGRVHHAFLFTGARGVGKTTAARALAKSLNCERGPTADPCGECASCVEIAAGRNPDLIEIDGASNNSVDDIRDLCDNVQYAPQRGGSKIYLIDEVHMLSKGAFNALLKTLEEPPPHVVFIFATTEPNKIPDTILSRVQRFDFKRIPEQGVITRLARIAEAEGSGVSEHGLRLIARAGEGSMRDSESLLDQVISFAGPEVSDQEVADILGLVDRRLLHDMLAGLVSGNAGKCLDVVATVYEYGYDLGQFTAELLEVVRNATFLRLSPAAHEHIDLPKEESLVLEEIVKEVNPEVLTRVFSALMAVIDDLARAGRPRLVLEMAVARLATIRPVQPVGALVERLQTIQRDLRTAGHIGPTAGLRGGASRQQWSDAAVVSESAKIAVTEAEKAPMMRASLPKKPWAFIAAELHPNTEWMKQAETRRAGDTVVLSLATTKLQADVRRLAADESFQDVFRRAYGPKTTLEVTLTPRIKDPEEAALRKIALEDPQLRTIIDTLGARVIKVRPTETGEDS